MTIRYRKTPEERTFDQVVDESWKYLSEAARTVVRKAGGQPIKAIWCPTTATCQSSTKVM